MTVAPASPSSLATLPVPIPEPRLGKRTGTKPVRIVCLADTHGMHDRIEVPDGDLLVHAGDMTMRGTADQVREFDTWLGTLPHAHKVIVAGNHDWVFERKGERARSLITNAIYLEDELTTVAGLTIWGSPWQPWFYDWAFNLPRGPALAEKWALIPNGTDVLITHGPPAAVLDRNAAGEATGCEDLRAAVRTARPRLHVFGHIHEAWGQCEIDGTTFVNASNCSLAYEPVQPPIVVELD